MNNDSEEPHYNSGTRHVEESENNSRNVNEAIINESSENAEGKEQGAENGISKRSKELASAAALLEQASDDELRDAGLVSVSESHTVSFSGMLPHPETFNRYDSETRERICRWNDAFTIDESRRQDRLVDNEIKQAEKSFNVSTILIVLSLIFPFLMYLLSGNPWLSGIFISYPIISIIGNVLTPVFSKSSQPKTKTKTK